MDDEYYEILNKQTDRQSDRKRENKRKEIDKVARKDVRASNEKKER